jgi:thiamine kinase-like enzyme
VRDGFVINLWTYHEPVVRSREIPPEGYRHALERLHADMRTIDVTTPHFLDRIADTQRDVANRDLTPELPDADRELLAGTLRSLRRSIIDRGAPEQLLHGEPHPWNLLDTRGGLLFIDFENAVRGPVEYDLAWVPEQVSARYPGVDQELVGECRGLMLAIIATWRWRRDDQHPSGPQRVAWLSAFREGPPWPAVDDV